MKIIERIIKENKEPLAVLGLKIMTQSSILCSVEDGVLHLYLPEYCWVGYEQDIYPYYTFYHTNVQEIYGLSRDNDYKIEVFRNQLHGNMIPLFYIRELLKRYGIKHIQFRFREKKKYSLLERLINFFKKLFGG